LNYKNMNEINQNLLNGLNPSQLDAIQTLEGPVLVLAGAGTGKTKVLTTRIANLIATGTAQADNILAVTFTNKAAKEMRERIEGMVGYLGGMWIGTFHSIGVRLLRMHAAAIDLEPNFAIIDEADRNKLYKQVIVELNIDEKRYPVKLISFLISSLKEKCITEKDENKVAGVKYKDLDVLGIYKKYQKKLKDYNLLDFDDLIMLTIQLFKNNPQILSDVQDRFTHILVDEYQDTGHSQHLLLKMLATKYFNICCVGDEDQSIYSWRGANVENILNFGKDYLGAKIIRLEQNYRSTNNILSVATSVIANNKSRYGKTLFSEAGNGESINIVHVQDNNQEGQEICNRMQYYGDCGEDYNNMAILVRASFQIRSIEEMLMRNNMPYRVVDGVKFYDKREIKDIVAYLRFIFSGQDRLAFERIINLPKRGIGDKTLASIFTTADNNYIGLTEAMQKMCNEGGFGPKIAAEVRTFVDQLKYWRSCALEDRCSLSELADVVVNQSGYLTMLKTEDPDDQSRVENVKELISALAGFNNIEEFLEHVALFGAKDSTEDLNAINILTMHGSKGLEYNVVFLPGWEEGVFPSGRSIEETGDAGLEEERRLAYVAITRARKELNIFYADSRFVFGRYQASIRSRFIDEMVKKLKSTDVIKLLSSKSGKFTYSSAKSNSYQPSSPKVERLPNFAKKTDEYVVPQSANEPTRPHHTLHKEDIVKHEKFGQGKVVGFIAHYVDVMFDDGTKRLIQKDFLVKN